MCIQREPFNYSNQLYIKHSETLTNFFTNEFVCKLEHADKQHPCVLLREWVQIWQCSKWVVDGMSRMFMYLDRFHVPNSEDLLSTNEQGYNIFKQCIYTRFQDSVKHAILNCINNERDNEEQNRELLRDAIHVFLELGTKLSKMEFALYKSDFHNDLVESTTDYYRRMSRIWLNQLSTPQYLSKVENCIESEKQRMLVYVDRHSQPAIIEEMRQELLRVHLIELLDRPSGMDEMLKNAINCNDNDNININTSQAATNATADISNYNNYNNYNNATENVSTSSGSRRKRRARLKRQFNNNRNNYTRRHKSDLARLYQLYSEIEEGHTLIAQRLKKHISKLGQRIILKSKELAESNRLNRNRIEKGRNSGNSGKNNNNNNGSSSSGDDCDYFVRETDHELILSLINLHNRFINIVRIQFCGNTVFLTFLKQAFEEFINKEYYLSMLLARYSNDVLIKGSKISNNNASSIDTIMNHIVMIYGYIRDKDIFERDYQRYFSMRLLENVSQSEEYERAMIGKLRHEAGYHWTNKLEYMFKDIETSKLLLKQFRSTKILNHQHKNNCFNSNLNSDFTHKSQNKNNDDVSMNSRMYNKENDHNCNGDININNINSINSITNENVIRTKNVIDFEMLVCTTGAWPSGHGGLSSYFTFDNKHIEQAIVTIPPCMKNLYQKFRKFYLHKYNNGRKLCLQMDKGKGELEIVFRENCKKIVVCTTYQMLILLLFNKKNIITFDEIVKETQIPIKDCQIHLLSMAHPKVKILRKSPNIRKCLKTDKFKINSNFTNPRARIVIPLINMPVHSTIDNNINNINHNNNNNNNNCNSDTSSMDSSLNIKNQNHSNKNYNNNKSYFSRSGSSSANSSCFSIDRENIGNESGSSIVRYNNVYDNRHNLRDIFVMRKAMMDAAIVRVMKARKTITHGELVSLVTKQLSARFEPKSLNIKKRIENLIEVEYIERDDKNRQLYHYKM